MFYGKITWVVITTLVFTSIGLIMSGILLPFNPYLAFKCAVFWIALSVRFSEAINAPAFLTHWEDDGCLIKAVLWDLPYGIFSNFVFFNALIPLYLVRGSSEGVRFRPTFMPTEKDLVTRKLSPEDLTINFMYGPAKSPRFCFL